MKRIEELARSLARSDFEKQAWVNPATVGGAIIGGGIGAIRGSQGSRESERGVGALGGAALGALSGAFIGGSGRALVKKVPDGWKQWGSGKKALEKEYEALNAATKKKVGDFSAYRDQQLELMRKAEDAASAGLNGKAARDAIDAVRKDKRFAAAGDFKAGKEQFYGAGLGGLAGLGFGAYQLKTTKDINKSDEQERALQEYVDLKEGRTKSASYEAVDRVGRLLARLPH